MLVDYPAAEDAEAGVLFSGLEKRAVVIHRLIKDLGIDQDSVSFASVARCITRSKAAVTYRDYVPCGELLLSEAADRGIAGIVAFGSIAGRLVTGSRIQSIDDVRGKVMESALPGAVCVVTYALSILTDRGCSACTSSVYPFLVRKDIETLVADLKKRRVFP